MYHSPDTQVSATFISWSSKTAATAEYHRAVCFCLCVGADISYVSFVGTVPAAHSERAAVRVGVRPLRGGGRRCAAGRRRGSSGRRTGPARVLHATW